MTGEVRLPDEVQAIGELMRANASGIPAEEAGRLICGAIKCDELWVFPGAQAHRRLVEREIEELLGAFPIADAEEQ